MPIFISKDIKRKDLVDNEWVYSLTEKYKKIASNLLNFENKNADHVLFFRLTKNNIDLSKLLNTKDLETIYKESTFKVELKKFKISDFNVLKNIEDENELINELKLLNINVSLKDKKILNENRKLFLDIIRNRYFEDSLSFANTWKKIKNEVDSYYAEKSIWPFYIGTFFIKFGNDTSKFRAPLLFKSIEIEIEDNRVFLKSKENSISLNEKLIFFLERENSISFPLLDENENVSLEKASKELLSFLKPVLNDTSNFFNILNNFNDVPKQNFDNVSLSFESGITTILGNPLGGKLREVVLELIKSKEIENLGEMDVTIDYDSISMSKLENQENLFRIVKTDSSQETAILASLNYNSIIIGPPGTGKSQVVSNLLINILLQNKKALFISDKKVALDVVLKRMKDYSKFCFVFPGKYSRTTKAEKLGFYEPIKWLFENIKKSANFNSDWKNETHLNDNGTPFFKKQELQYSNEKMKIANVEKSEFLKAKELIDSFKQMFESKDVDFLKDIKNSLKMFKNKEDFFDYFENTNNKKELSKKLGEFRKFLFFHIYTDSFRDKMEIAKDIQNNEKISFDQKIYDLIFDIKNLDTTNLYDQYLKISIDYLNWNDNERKIDNTNIEDFKNATQQILKNSLSKLKKLQDYYKSKDLKNVQNMMGRINRSFTPPSSFINLYKKILKNIYKIFIGTPDLLSGFIDFKKDKFDYVIFDEASQLFIEKALPFISLGKIIIVAGDDQQLQPSNWFASRINDEEDVYFENEEANVDSLLDWAKLKGFPKYYLQMNYRSNFSELVTFSSKEFYNSELRCLDQNNKDALKNEAIEIIELNNSIWDAGVNVEEAERVLEILFDNMDKYNDIIILTFNAKQKEYILNLMLTNYYQYFGELLNNRVFVKNIENIQGDEADLVIATISYTATTKLSGTYVVSPKSSGRNALNVAITRAKEKMIVVKSIKSTDVKITNENNIHILTFKKWLEFLELKSEEKKAYSPIQIDNDKDVESDFELNVFKKIEATTFTRNILIKSQFNVGSYRIDIALIDEKTHKFLLGIEVDGYAYHSGFLKMNEDRKRQDFIEAKGYKIYRVTESNWINNYEKEISKIRDIVELSLNS